MPAMKRRKWKEEVVQSLMALEPRSPLGREEGKEDNQEDEQHLDHMLLRQVHHYLLLVFLVESWVSRSIAQIKIRK
jgi:hypothetical protein